MSNKNIETFNKVIEELNAFINNSPIPVQYPKYDCNCSVVYPFCLLKRTGYKYETANRIENSIRDIRLYIQQEKYLLNNYCCTQE